MAMIFAKDLPRMAAFYCETLGLPVVPETRTDHWLELDAGAVGLGLHAIPESIAEGIEIETPPVAREATPVKLVFAADDWEAQCDKLERLGVTVMRKPWGGADCLDPEGNVFHIRGR